MKKGIDKNNEKGTFVVHIHGRQKSTWQGEVIWAEKKKEIKFRSALELIKVIEGALDSEINSEEFVRGGSKNEKR